MQGGSFFSKAKLGIEARTTVVATPIFSVGMGFFVMSNLFPLTVMLILEIFMGLSAIVLLNEVYYGSNSTTL